MIRKISISIEQLGVDILNSTHLKSLTSEPKCSHILMNRGFRTLCFITCGLIKEAKNAHKKFVSLLSNCNESGLHNIIL
jgi:hypothetical protein